MSTNTITTDTTRTNQKSQLVDDPYFHSLHLHHVLTQLLDDTMFTNKWFSRVSKVLNIRKKDLYNHILLNINWKVSWGKLSISPKCNNVIWIRPDQGPEIINDTNTDTKIQVIRFMLMARLIEAFKDLDMSSYEEVGLTKNWQRAKVKLNMTEMDNVSWADALTGKVAIKAMMEDEKILTGHIDIFLKKENLSFF
jgi:hypothetical protein